MQLKTVCVYCASSSRIDPVYLKAAQTLGKLMTRHAITIVYGGGAIGSMGELATAALNEGGNVIGIIPRFMQKLEWAHKGLSQLMVVQNLHQRKRMMIKGVDAVIALPGGSGTLEELLEAITWKRLGLFIKPIIIVNVNHFFDPLIAMFDKIIAENFMDERHQQMWTVVDESEAVIEGIQNSASWTKKSRQFAAL